MPEKGISLVPHGQILSYEEILDFVRFAVSRGITKIRLTGGEPLVRKGILSLVHSLAAIGGIRDLGMTTNGILLSEMARDLRQAGLHRLNISLDTLDPQRYRTLTCKGELSQVLKGIDAAQRAGFGKEGSPIKLNCVLLPDTTEEELEKLRNYARDRKLELRLIRRIDLKNGSFGKVFKGDGGDCPRCNRIRLTSTGILKPCLLNNLGYDIRALGAEKALEAALQNKPLAGSTNTCDTFNYIGG